MPPAGRAFRGELPLDDELSTAGESLGDNKELMFILRTHVPQKASNNLRH